MTVLSGFEVLSQSLIPDGAQNIPYVVQAYFVQVSYPSDAGTDPVKFDLTFEETTGFNQGIGQGGVMAQYIDESGAVVHYPTFITAGSPTGFLAQQIAPGQTKIYSVTVAPPSPDPAMTAAAKPQSGTGWRGTVSLNANAAGQLIATPTQRQIYFTGDLSTITDSVVTSIPTASGGTRI